MLGHYLLTLYRSLSRHRLYAAINVLGLAVGIAVFLVLFLDVRFETSFEKWIPNAQQLYVVTTNIDRQGATPSTGGFVLEQLRSDYPQVVGARDNPARGVVRQNGRATSEQVEEVDSNFLDVLELPLVEGDRALLLSAPNDLVINEAKAKQYFGAADPVGQTLTVDVDGHVDAYRVTGVIKTPPASTDYQFDFLVPLRPPAPAQLHNWRRLTFAVLNTFLRFDSPKAAQALNGEMDRFADRYGGTEEPGPAHTWATLRVAPLLAQHLTGPVAAMTVTALGAVGALTLLLAAINYVNLATARSGLRAREVALRKVMGATGGTLIGQFMAEAVATASLGALIGLALCELALPAVNAAGGLALKLDYLRDSWLWATLLGVIIVVGVGAGLYPALILSRFQPAAVLAASRSPGGGRASGRVREVLVAFQFAVAVAFTIATLVMVSQTYFVRHMDRGFSRDGVVVVPTFALSGLTDIQRNSLLTAWRALPGVVSATASGDRPGDEFTPSNHVKQAGAPGEGPTVFQAQIGPDFFETYGAHLIAGRLPNLRYGGDFLKSNPWPIGPGARTASSPRVMRNVVINARAVTALGFHSPKDAIGKPIVAKQSVGLQPYMIIGVVSDIRFNWPRQPLPPMAYIATGADMLAPQAAVRYSGTDFRAITDKVAADWRRIAPTQPFEAKTIDQALQPYYKYDEQNGRLFTIGAILAVGIGCVGLYGLASFNTARRVKEIGIRKTLGASTTDILKLLIGQFLRPVLIANLIAWPLAWWVMHGWLSGFDQRIALTPTYFVAATALTLLVAVGTVAGQAYAVARAEPAKALRHD
jgi:putative ABC transport system permease protein